ERARRRPSVPHRDGARAGRRRCRRLARGRIVARRARRDGRAPAAHPVSLRRGQPPARQCPRVRIDRRGTRADAVGGDSRTPRRRDRGAAYRHLPPRPSQGRHLELALAGCRPDDRRRADGIRPRPDQPREKRSRRRRTRMKSAFQETPRVAQGPVAALETRLRALLSPSTLIAPWAPLARRTTLRVGGCAELLVEPADERDLAITIAEARSLGVPWRVIGRGSNLLV